MQIVKVRHKGEVPTDEQLWAQLGPLYFVLSDGLGYKVFPLRFQSVESVEVNRPSLYLQLRNASPNPICVQWWVNHVKQEALLDPYGHAIVRLRFAYGERHQSFTINFSELGFGLLVHISSEVAIAV